jgi:hypothetical protein
VDDPAIFATAVQRQVVYALALYRDVQVVERGILVRSVSQDPVHERVLREGTKLFLALRAHDRATVVEESRSLGHARQEARALHSKGETLRTIADHLDQEMIPTRSGKGSWSPSAVRDLLRADSEGTA